MARNAFALESVPASTNYGVRVSIRSRIARHSAGRRDILRNASAILWAWGMCCYYLGRERLPRFGACLCGVQTVKGRPANKARQAARAAGTLYYYGAQCRASHAGLRYVSTGGCVYCLLSRAPGYRAPADDLRAERLAVASLIIG